MRYLILSLLIVSAGCAKTTTADFRPLAAAVLAVQPVATPVTDDSPVERPTPRVEEPTAPRVQCLIFCTNPCPPCEGLKQDLQQTLLPLGWRIGPGVDQTIRFIDSTQPAGKELAERYRVRQFPTLAILADNREVDRVIGRISAVELSWRVRGFILDLRNASRAQ